MLVKELDVTFVTMDFTFLERFVEKLIKAIKKVDDCFFLTLKQMSLKTNLLA